MSAKGSTSNRAVITILLADDHRILREGLRWLLEEVPGIKIVGEAADGRIAVELAARLAPKIVLMDIGMPVLNGIEATREIASASPETRVIALTMYRDRSLVVKMLEAGASGYLLKDCAFDELLQALRCVSSGHPYLSASIEEAVLEEVRDRGSGRTANDGRLTPRERRVVQLLGEGRSTREAALLMGISVKTLETHRSNILKKLKLRNIAQLTKYAIREGLTSLDI